MMIQGFKEIRAVLDGLPKELNHKLLQSVHAEAAIPLVNKAHLLAPVDEGILADSIGVDKPNIKKVNEIGLIMVGPRRGKFKAYHAHLVEYGTVERYNKSGASRGVMPKKPFMEPAYESEKGTLFNRIDQILGAKITAFMRRKIKSTGGTWLKV